MCGAACAGSRLNIQPFALFIAPDFHDPGRAAHSNDMTGDIFGDNAVGADDRPIADRGVRQYDDIVPDPYVIANGHGAAAGQLSFKRCFVGAGLVLPRVGAVGMVGDVNLAAHQDIATNRYFVATRYMQMVAGGEVLTNVDLRLVLERKVLRDRV